MLHHADLLRDAADADPEGAALVSVDRRWSFAELDRAVASLAARLYALGIRPRQTIALDLPAAHEWIATLALFRLAARSVSIAGVTEQLPVTVDAVLRGAHHTSRLTADDPSRSFSTSLDWFDAPDGEADAPRIPYPRPDSVCRLMLTSGTTGRPRAARFSPGMIADRLARLDWTNARPELNLMPLSTTGGLLTAHACLVHRTPYLAVDAIAAPALRLAAAAQVSVLAGSPQQIGHALRILDEQQIALPGLTEVRLAGGVPSAALLGAIEERLGVVVRSVYGSTEAGGIAHRVLAARDDTSDVGTVSAAFEARVVDAAGTPLGSDEVGELELRGRGVVDGYEGPQGLEPLSGGWFRPGDQARLTSDRRIVLAGRTSELINLGGVKVDPARIDELALAHPGVLDAGAFALERSAGILEVGLAVVATPECDLRALDRELRQRMRLGHPTVFSRLDTIPRNRMGKVQRAVLAADVGLLLARQR